MKLHVQRLRDRVPYGAYVEEFAQLRIPFVFPPTEAAPNLEPRDDRSPTTSSCRVMEGGKQIERPRYNCGTFSPQSESSITRSLA